MSGIDAGSRTKPVIPLPPSGTGMAIMVGTGNFFDGYIDGWQSVKPDTIPKLPAADIPPGVPEYRYGYDMGRSAAKDAQMGAQDFEDGND